MRSGAVANLGTGRGRGLDPGDRKVDRRARSSGPGLATMRAGGKEARYARVHRGGGRSTAGRRGFDAYLEAFEAETEGRYRHPKYSTATAQQFSGTFHNARLDDIVMAEYRATSRIRTEELATLEEDQVRLYVVHRGRQLLNDPLGQGDVRLDPGNFFLGRLTHDHHFETGPSIAALNLFLPGHHLGDLLRDRPLMSTAVSAPLRILSAYVAMVQPNLPTSAGPALRVRGPRCWNCSKAWPAVSSTTRKRLSSPFSRRAPGTWPMRSSKTHICPRN